MKTWVCSACYTITDTSQYGSAPLPAWSGKGACSLRRGAKGESPPAERSKQASSSAPKYGRLRTARYSKVRRTFSLTLAPSRVRFPINTTLIKTRCTTASHFYWCAKGESNPRPSHSECATLSPELLAQIKHTIYL